MNSIIEDFYKKNGVPSFLIKQKDKKLLNHPDIEAELAYWIEKGEYKKENPVMVEGYSAEKLAEKSKFLTGESSFMMLIELRENKEQALKQIEQGFKMK